jgi:hypothetical protein
MVDNPKRRGKGSWKRYNLYRNASTLREIIELSVTASETAARAKQISKAKEDIKYDFLHGYILFPQYATYSPSHFVNAGEIALMANVMNVHQLYSEEEMDEARQIADAEKASETVRMIEEKCKQIKLQEACAFVSFHTQIASLWDLTLAYRITTSFIFKKRVSELHSYPALSPMRRSQALSSTSDRASTKTNGTTQLKQSEQPLNHEVPGSSSSAKALATRKQSSANTFSR